ncbi:T9SS type A sorting domain-containing protein, partial [Viscerimonas tarda]
AGYYLYDDNGAPESDLMDTPRGNSPTDNQYRFIFEETIDRVALETSITVASTEMGKDILIGNPFMEHLDFDKFHTHGNNSNLIADHYRLIDESGNYATYSMSGVSTGSPTVLTRHIAPMQAILVTPQTTFAANALRTSLTMTQHHPGNNLRSAQAEETTPQYMRISISDTKVRNRTALVYDPEANTGTSYNPEKDIYKMLKQGEKTLPSIYFITDEGYYMDIKQLSSLTGKSISLGICFDGTGPMALGFENLLSFMQDKKVYLEDKQLDKQVELKKASPFIYTFNKTTSDTFLDDRFVLRFGEIADEITGTSNEEQSKLSYRTSHNQLEVFNLNGSLLDEVTVYDLQGRIAGKQQNAAQTIFNLSTGVYVVKAISKDSVDTIKVVVE